jgi:hypothetical protein
MIQLPPNLGDIFNCQRTSNNGKDIALSPAIPENHAEMRTVYSALSKCGLASYKPAYVDDDAKDRRETWNISSPKVRRRFSLERLHRFLRRDFEQSELLTRGPLISDSRPRDRNSRR